MLNFPLELPPDEALRETPLGTATRLPRRTSVVSLETMPILSDVASRALKIARDPLVKIGDLGMVVQQDPALTTGVLKMANSVVYRGKFAIKDIPSAIVRLGIKECTRLIAALSVRKLFTGLTKQLQQCCDALTTHAFLTASIATGINGVFKLGFTGEEFVSGILHDVGRSVLIINGLDTEPQADVDRWFEESDALSREDYAFGTNHCTVGGEFAHVNHLPEAIQAALKHHHHPEEAGNWIRLAALINHSEALANFVIRHRQIHGYALDRCVGFGLISSDWSNQQLAEYAKTISAILAQAIKDTRAMAQATD